MPKKESELEISQRAERIQQTIALLESQKAELERNQLVAPMGSYVARYQARGQKHRYWYYQLRASSAIFAKTNKVN